MLSRDETETCLERRQRVARPTDTESECGLLIEAELELNMTTTPKNSAQVTEMSHTLRNGQPQPSARRPAQSSNTTGIVFVSFVCFLELHRLYRCTVYCKIKKSWTGKNVKRLHHEFPTVCQGLLYTHMGAGVFACEGVSIVATCCEGGRGLIVLTARLDGRFRGGGSM